MFKGVLNISSLTNLIIFLIFPLLLKSILAIDPLIMWYVSPFSNVYVAGKNSFFVVELSYHDVY